MSEWVGCPCCGELHVEVTETLNSARAEEREEIKRIIREESAISSYRVIDAILARMDAR